MFSRRLLFLIVAVAAILTVVAVRFSRRPAGIDAAHSSEVFAHGDDLSRKLIVSGHSDRQTVVLTEAGARQIGRGGTWQPTEADIAGLEEQLSQVSKLKPGNWPAASNIHIDHPDAYFRQYAGIIEGGKKRIYVNAFCGMIAPPADWHKRLVAIMDGGRCVWQAIYDPLTGTFLSLTVNGVA